MSAERYFSPFLQIFRGLVARPDKPLDIPRDDVDFKVHDAARRELPERRGVDCGSYSWHEQRQRRRQFDATASCTLDDARPVARAYTLAVSHSSFARLRRDVRRRWGDP